MLTVVDAQQNTFSIDTDASIEVENLKAILEADAGVPTNFQELKYQNKSLTDGKKTLASYGVQNGDLVVLHDTRDSAITSGSSQEMAMAEALRSQILSYTPLQNDLRTVRLFAHLEKSTVTRCRYGII